MAYERESRNCLPTHKDGAAIHVMAYEYESCNGLSEQPTEKDRTTASQNVRPKER